jgi:hypothetical protein
VEKVEGDLRKIIFYKYLNNNDFIRKPNNLIHPFKKYKFYLIIFYKRVEKVEGDLRIIIF